MQTILFTTKVVSSIPVYIEIKFVSSNLTAGSLSPGYSWFLNHSITATVLQVALNSQTPRLGRYLSVKEEVEKFVFSLRKQLIFQDMNFSSQSVRVLNLMRNYSVHWFKVRVVVFYASFKFIGFIFRCVKYRFQP